METVRFWGREGAKMVNFVRREKEELIQVVLDKMLEAASSVGKNLEAKDVLALGGMLLMGDTAEDSKEYFKDYMELWNTAYDAPPYHEPPGRMWSSSKQELQDDVLGLIDEYKVDEIFVWHHVGHFGDDVEMAALKAFSEAVIQRFKKNNNCAFSGAHLRALETESCRASLVHMENVNWFNDA